MSIDTYGTGKTYSNIDNISGADHGGLNGLADDDHTLYYHSGDAAELASLKLTTGITATIILDEDSMATDSATALASQQSIKSYSDIGSTPALQHIRSLPLFNSMSYDSFGTDITSDGATITVALAKQGGGNIVVQIDGVLLTYTAGGLALTPGTDTVPVKNYCWMYNNGGTATLDHNITGFPDGVTAHVKICTAVLPSATLSQTENVYSHQNMNQSIANQDSSHIEHISAWIRAQPSTWFSGVAQTLTITPNGGAPDAVIFSVASGITFQMHRHIFPALTSEYYIVNDSATLFDRILDLNGLLLDSTGASMSGKYFNLVIWGNQCSNDDSDDCKLFVNLPSGSYNTSPLAISDANNFSNFSIPNFFLSTGFLISRLTIRHQVASSGTWTSIEEADLRGTFPSQISGSVASSNIWQRNGTNISPINSGGIILIDEINEETSDAGVTIEQIEMIDGIAIFTTPSINPGIIIEGNTDGHSEILLRKTVAGDEAVIHCRVTGAETGWKIGQYETDDFTIYNVGTVMTPLSISKADDIINITTGIAVNSVTADFGLYIRGNANGDATMVLHTDGVADIGSIRYSDNATVLWEIGTQAGSNDYTIYNENTNNTLLGFNISSDNCTFGSTSDIFAPSLYGNVINDRPLHVAITTGEIGTVSSITAHKKNIRSLTYDDAKWLYDVDPKLYNRRVLDKSLVDGVKQQIPTEEIYPWIEPGMLAEDVEEHCEPLCYYSDMDTRTGLQGYRDDKLFPYMIKLIQEQKTEIENLKTENQNQTNVINNLLTELNGVSGIKARLLAIETAMGMN